MFLSYKTDLQPPSGEKKGGGKKRQFEIVQDGFLSG